jgi:hypothetical protein
MADRYVPQYPAAFAQASEGGDGRHGQASQLNDGRAEQDDPEALQRLRINIEARRKNVELLELEAEYRELGRRERELLAQKAAYEKQQGLSSGLNGSIRRPVTGSDDDNRVAVPKPPKAAASELPKAVGAQPAAGSAPRKSSANEPVLMPAVPGRHFSLTELPAATAPKRIPNDPKAMKRAPASPPAGNRDRDRLEEPRQAASHALNYEGFNNEAVRYGGGKRPPIGANANGGLVDVPTSPTEVKPQVRVHQSALQYRLEQLRAKQTTALRPPTQINPTPPANAVQTSSVPQGTPAPVLNPSQLQLVWPDGVIPGITPNWQGYLQLQKKDTGN